MEKAEKLKFDLQTLESLVLSLPPPSSESGL